MSASLIELQEALLATPLSAIALTLAAYLASLWIVERIGRPSWCPAVLLAALLVAASLWMLSIDVVDYQRGAGWLMLLLGPATVALGVPLYQQLHHIRALWKPLALSLPPAAALASCYSLALAWALGASPEVLASLAPKSVTAPIALGIIDELGGSVPLLMGGLLITGVMATLAVSLLAAPLGIRDHRILGFALGINGHAIGTVRAFEMSPTAGAFASLGMSLTGIFTALCLPLAWRLLGL
ncbi:LrgB family protein [Halomonas sp. I5-271120]|uniref:LrgB family protein n=1 Tax=Halomonas sp. I5-271120 TaxID=3061632 RepID=UPI00271554AF|nr:LrgB family protein [Halomonas sp. I5-271120]